MSRDQSDPFQGTLELLVLKTLSLEPMHRWGNSGRVRQMSAERLQVSQGILYPESQRMKTKGWIVSAWRVTEHNRPRYDSLTAARRRCECELSSVAVNRVLDWAGAIG